VRPTPQPCPSCGAKIGADRQKCPRCNARLVGLDPAAASVRSRRLAQWTGGLVALFVLTLGVMWLKSDGQPSIEAAARAPKDPLAQRRAAGAAAAAAPDAAAPAARPFLDSSGSAAVAYSSGDFDGALQQYQAALDRNPQDAESLSNMGQVLVRLGRPEEALPYFEKAIALIPNRWAYRFNLARALSVLGRWDESVANYRQAQELFPNDYATTFNLGLVLHKKGDDAGAIEEYRKAIELAPTDASFRFALALSYERLRRNPEAIAAYEEYLRLAPNASDADTVRARVSQLSGTPAAAAGTPGITDLPR